MYDNTILTVVRDGLCTGCGTCIALCPANAIKISIDEINGIYVPELDKRICNNCGICYRICPGHEVDFSSMDIDLFGKEPENSLIGNHINCYIAYSADHDIRYNSASGGLATQLLVSALESGFISGALVTGMKVDKPLEPKPFIARTREEIINASKSKYCPVPANIALKTILESDENEKFAVVGLPCHIHGIRKAEQINKKLKEKIVLHVGLICNHAPTFLATEYLLEKMNVEKKDVKCLDYRGEGWPGGMKIITKSGNRIFIPQFSPDYWGIVFNSFFFPLRCMLCSDKVCRLADIVLADAWSSEMIRNDTIGTSLVISRNEISERILNDLTMKEQIKIKKIDENIVIRSQGLDIIRKRVNSCTGISMILGKKIPVYGQSMLDVSFFDYLRAISFFSRNVVLSKRHFWRTINLYQLSLKYAAQLKYRLKL